MEWASVVADDIWREVKPFLPSEHYQEVATAIYDIAKEHDPDTWAGTTQLEQDAKVNQNLTD